MLALGLALFFFFLDDKTPTVVKLSAVGTSLASSVIYAVIFTSSAYREQRDLMRSELATQFATLALGLQRANDVFAEDLRAEVLRLGRGHLPAATYPGTREFDPRFNRDLMDHLRKSRVYIFRGSSAKYVSARIRFLAASHQTHLESLHIVMQNPSSPTAIRRRATDRKRNPKYHHKSESDLTDEIRKEVVCSIIALYDLRNVVPVEIAFLDSDPSVTRVEVLDQSCYISLYNSEQAREFPETLRYDHGSTLHDMFRLEVIRQFADATLRIRFSHNDGEPALERALQSVGVTKLPVADLARLRISNERFYDTFSNHLATLG